MKIQGFMGQNDFSYIFQLVEGQVSIDVLVDYDIWPNPEKPDEILARDSNIISIVAYKNGKNIYDIDEMIDEIWDILERADFTIEGKAMNEISLKPKIELSQKDKEEIKQILKKIDQKT